MMPSIRRAFLNAEPASSIAAGQNGSDLISITRSGPSIFAGSSRYPTTSPNRSPFAITGTSSACTIRKLATAAGSLSRSFATNAADCSIWEPRVQARRPTVDMPMADCTLKGGVREVLATEMLEALGVNTSKSFALFETGEALERGDEPSPTRSSVLTRDSATATSASARSSGWPSSARSRASTGSCAIASKISIPSSRRRTRAERAPAVRSRQRRDGEAPPPISLRLRPRVLNSDNINITGRASTIGRGGSRLTGTRTSLPPISIITASIPLPGSQKRSNGTSRSLEVVCHWSPDAPKLSEQLGRWSDRFEQALARAMLWRLGVASGKNDADLAAALIKALARRAQPIDRVFFDWRGGRDRGEEAYPHQEFRELARLLAGRERPQSHPYWSDSAPCSMHINEVEAIWSAIADRDDWRPFEEKITAVRRMGEAMDQDAPAA